MDFHFHRYIYFLSLLFSYIFIFRKVRSHPVIIIFLIYLASSFGSIFLDYNYLALFNWHPEEYKISGYIYYSLCIIICLSPIIHLNKYDPLKEPFKITKSIQNFLLVWSLLSLYSIIYHLPYTINALKSDVSDIRYILNTEKESILPENYWTTLAVTVAAFYNFFIFIFFRILASSPKFKKTLIYCLVASITYVFSSLTFGARDGLLFFGISTIFSYFFYRNAYSVKLRKNISKILILVSSLTILILGRFTYQRFFSNTDLSYKTAIQIGVLGYFSQQPYVFNESIWQHKKSGKFHGHSLRLPLFDLILGKHELPNRNIPVEWSFGSFIKDFYDINGNLSLIGFLIIFTSYFHFHFKRVNKYHPIRNLILLSFYWQFLLSGLFYFKLGSFAGNVTILIYLLAFWLLKYVYPNKTNYSLNG